MREKIKKGADWFLSRFETRSDEVFGYMQNPSDSVTLKSHCTSLCTQLRFITSFQEVLDSCMLQQKPPLCRVASCVRPLTSAHILAHHPWPLRMCCPKALTSDLRGVVRSTQPESRPCNAATVRRQLVSSESLLRAVRWQRFVYRQ